MDSKSAIVTGLWVASVAAGVVAMVRYQATAGQAATPPKSIAPAATGTRGDLLVFIHPQCPCSRATVSELARIIASRPHAYQTTFYFYKPSAEPDRWCTGTAIWNDAQGIRDATLKIDVDAKAAKKYGARCSGQVLLYSPNGKLEFSGGVTSGRGHEGESNGGDALDEFARTGACGIHTTPVYGCAIWSDLDSKDAPQRGSA